MTSDVEPDEDYDQQISDQLSVDLFFLQVPCLQYEFKSDQECVSVKGRLSRALEFWKDINASDPQFTLECY